MIKAGEALEQAQRDAMSGEAGGFDAARRDEGAAIRRLRDAAEELMPSATTATVDRVARTLTAAAASSEGRVLLKQGRLTEDLEPPGFEALAGAAAQAKPARKGRGAPPRRRVETLRRRKREADEEAERKAGEARELERAAREAEQEAKRATRAAAAARKKADAAAAQADRIEAELTELRKRD